jgi:hypothetical protein
MLRFILQTDPNRAELNMGGGDVPRASSVSPGNQAFAGPKSDLVA